MSERLTEGFFFDCTPEELYKLREMGNGNPSLGLRKLLLQKASGVSDELKEAMKGFAIDAIKLAPSVILNLTKGKK